jgi:hypothetical protein
MVDKFLEAKWCRKLSSEIFFALSSSTIHLEDQTFRQNLPLKKRLGHVLYEFKYFGSGSFLLNCKGRLSILDIAGIAIDNWGGGGALEALQNC